MSIVLDGEWVASANFTDPEQSLKKKKKDREGTNASLADSIAIRTIAVPPL